MNALTGGIATGKSSVAALFQQLGAVIIDSDVLAREVVAPGTPGLAQVAERFGPEVLTADGALDRAALGRVVFADDQARADLNSITHPLIQQRRRELLDAAPDGAVVIQVIPLLVEIGVADQYDVIIVVDLDPRLQLERLRARDHLDDRQAKARIDAQAPPSERLAVATHVIDNSLEPAKVAMQVREIWHELTRNIEGDS